MAKVKLYNKTKPYGTLSVLSNGKKYYLLAPVAIDQDYETGLQSWSVVSMSDGIPAWSVVSMCDGIPDQSEYSKELGAFLHDEVLTLIIHPTNVAIELSDNLKDVYYWSGEYAEEPNNEEDVFSESCFPV